MTILVNEIRCKKFGEKIESTYTHDFRSFKRGACAVDGGHEYLRRCDNPENWEELSVWEPDGDPKQKMDSFMLAVRENFLFERGSSLIMIQIPYKPPLLLFQCRNLWYNSRTKRGCGRRGKNPRPGRRLESRLHNVPTAGVV